MRYVQEADLEITHLKGSGPGGQNRNKRMTGVRVKHLPTGLVVVATERRSQNQNLQAALERLEEKLVKLNQKPVLRKKTKPTLGSQRKRLDVKKATAFKKKLRSNKTGEWD